MSVPIDGFLWHESILSCFVPYSQILNSRCYPSFILAQVMSKTKLPSVGQNIFLEMQLDSGLAYGHINTETETTSTACSMNF